MKKQILPLLTTLLSLLPSIVQAQTYTPSNRIPIADTSQIGTKVSGTNNNFTITGGLNRGQNLFHSFTDFSVPTNGSANFTNPASNRSIITRVTGNLFSDINGLLNTNGANFLLINPNGVVFGPGVKLDVGKAFVTSTANGIDFVDVQGRNYNFGVNQAGDAPLLTIDPNVAFNPSKLIIGGSGSKGIENYGTLETKNPNQYIGLIGGNINFNGGKINAPGGRVELGGLSAPGTVGLSVEGNLLRAQFPTNVTRGDVSFTNGARVSVAGAGGGDIAITARNLEILGDSQVRGGIEEGLGTPASIAGDIKVNTTGEIALVGSNTRILNNVNLNSKGNGGNITINAGSASLRDGAQLQSLTFGQGNAGNVTVTAKDAVSLASSASILSTVETGGVGKGGNISIDAGSLSLRDGAQLVAITRGASATQPAGKGDAGNVTVKVSGAVDIAGTKDGFSSGINSLVQTGTVGNAGNITIDAGSVSLQDGATLVASTAGQGNAGDIKIKTQGNIIISGTNDPQALAANTFDAISRITTSSRGQGNAGKISFETPGKLSLLNRGFILSDITDKAIGNSQGVSIKAGEVELNNAASIGAATSGRGNGGDIDIKTIGDLTISGKSYIITDTFNTGNNQFQGNAGNISIDTGNFKLIDSDISSTTSRTGNAGNIGIKARGDITLAGTATFVNDQPTNISKSRIVSASFGLGNAGKISIDNPSGKLSLSFSDITNAIGDTNVSGISPGITINARELEMKNNSLIFSDLFGKGQAGNIDIKTTGDITISGNNKDPLKITPFNISAISSSTRGIGDGGKISIDTQGKLSLDSTGSIFSIVDKDAQGTSKGIKINAQQLNLTNNGSIGSSTLGKNPGGDIEIVTTGAVNIVNSSSIQSNGIKAAGTLNVPGGKDLLLSSTGEGKAGNISISSERLNLDQGIIVAIGNSDSGGNITLNLSDKLLLRNDSTISTSSGEDLGKDLGGGTGGGNGGNITINSPLIVALPANMGGNDITANAFTGKGGKINITSQGLFGIQYRAKGSPLTNDITASSDFGLSGSVQINTPGTDPGKDKGELPAATNDASKQISQACGASQRDNKFYITGRGGLPPNASEPQESEALWSDAREVKTKPATTANLPPKYPPPAIGWVFQPDGRVRLIAAQTTVGATEPRVVCPNK
jgi:filamentous hemagglutinin family protein